MNRRYLKSQAKEILKQHYWQILLLVVLISLASLDFIGFETQVNLNTNQSVYVLSVFNLHIPLSISPLMVSIATIGGIAGLLFTILFVEVLYYGRSNVMKYYALGKEKEFDVLDGFRFNYKKIVITKLMASIHIILWSLLLIVPGVIKAYQYYFVDEILEEHPEWSYKQILRESKRMTQGHKMELFILGLSFILWHLLVAVLSMVTFGLANYLLQPYIYMTQAYAYLWVKELDEATLPFTNEMTF